MKKYDTSKAQVLPVLLDVRQVASILNCSIRHVFRLSETGRIPHPIKLGALVRWPKVSLDRWIDKGCPSTQKILQRRSKNV